MEAKNRLLQAIRNNEAADWLLYSTLKDASVQVGPVTLKVWSNLNDNLHEYREAWLVLTSPEGREYIQKQLNAVLDYIEELVKTP